MRPAVFAATVFGRAFLRPMPGHMAASYRRYPNHLLSVLGCSGRFRRDLTSDVQISSDIHLQGHTTLGEFLSGNAGCRNLLRPRGNNDGVIPLYGPTRELNCTT